MRIEELWQEKTLLGFTLFPLSLFYCAVTKGQRIWYEHRKPNLCRPPFKAIIIVGNITVGGTGKTPMVIWLCEYVRKLGYRPGVISRGYGGHPIAPPQEVTAHSDPVEVGDEPVMIARHAHCPIVVDPNRMRGAQYLSHKHGCEVLISDDGLQHYALPRDIEIVMIDGQRHFGNGLCLPAGPLRESVTRLQEVDFVVATQHPMAPAYTMQLEGNIAVPLDESAPLCKLETFAGECVHAVAGIGHPERFFNSLTNKGIQIIPHPFPDHHAFKSRDILFQDDRMVLMTEKDSVKCKTFADERHYFVPVKAQLEDDFITALTQRLQAIVRLHDIR